MNIYACTHAPRYTVDNQNGYADLDRFLRSAEKDRFGVHHIVEYPEIADLILYVKAGRPDCKDILSDPIYRAYAQKCFLVESSDNPFPYLPGVYTCIHRLCYTRSRTRTGFYQKILSDHDPLQDCNGSYVYLCSFMGRFSTHPVRARLAPLAGRDIMIENVVPSPASEMAAVNTKRRRYSEVMAQSAFILCPRGYGVSSFRLFEAMRAGRCPVIISDDWIPPEGPLWESCSIRIRERDVPRLPRLLDARLEDAERLGGMARLVWDDWFSETSSFHRIIEWCLDIDRCRRFREPIARKTVLWRKALHQYSR
ncbi:MAG: exostosin family protein [Kiritimatiellia bacterium]